MTPLLPVGYHALIWEARVVIRWHIIRDLLLLDPTGESSIGHGCVGKPLFVWVHHERGGPGCCQTLIQEAVAGHKTSPATQAIIIMGNGD